jgi:hypothetical protein
MTNVKEDQEIFIDHLHHLIDYWDAVPNKSAREKMEGVVFSLLVTLDGYNVGLNGYHLVPMEVDDDGIPEPINADRDIAGGLHDNFHRL